MSRARTRHTEKARNLLCCRLSSLAKLMCRVFFGREILNSSKQLMSLCLWCFFPRLVLLKILSFTGGQKGLSIFHKKYEQHNKRHRQGYDEDLGMSLSRVAKVRPLLR